MVTIRQGGLEEVLQIVRTITEFRQQETLESLQTRISGKASLVLIAEDEGELLGFKIGYEVDKLTFYSWFGGVSPIARNRGVAQQLLEVQEEWVRDMGYHSIKVKSRNEFPSMLRLLLRNGYLIEKLEEKEKIESFRVHFIKQL